MQNKKSSLTFKVFLNLLPLLVAPKAYAQLPITQEAPSPISLNQMSVPNFIVEKPKVEPLRLTVTLNDNKSTEPWFWPPSAGTAAFLTLVASIFLFYVRALHERRMSKTEADSKLKEKIYLDVAESLAVAMRNFGILLSGKPDEYFTAMNESKFSEAIYKLNLVATDKTLEKMNAFSTTWGRTSFEMAASGTTIQLLDQKADRLNKMIEEILKNQERLIARWKEVPENHRTPDLTASLSREFDDLQNDYKLISDDRNESWKMASIKRHELTMNGISNMKKMIETISEVALAFRQELQQPINESTYRARSLASAEEFERLMVQFKKDLDKAYEQSQVATMRNI